MTIYIGEEVFEACRSLIASGAGAQRQLVVLLFNDVGGIDRAGSNYLESKNSLWELRGEEEKEDSHSSVNLY